MRGQRGGALGAAPGRREAIPAARGFPQLPFRLASARERLERRRLLRNQRERAHQQLAGRLGLAQLAQPDSGRLDQQLGAFLAAHRQRALVLGELQHHVPLRARRVDAAQLAQGAALLGAGCDGVAEAARRRVEIAAPLDQDLAEAQQQARALLRVLGEIGRRQAPLVEGDELVPAPGDEPLLFERCEGAGIPRIREEALAVALENRRHPDLSSSRTDGGVPQLHRPGRRRS